MNWVIFALLSLTFSATFQILSRILAVKSENPRVFSTIFNAIAAALAFLLLFLEPWSIKSFPPLGIIFLTLLSTVLYGIFERTQFYVRKNIDASTLTILFRLAPVVTLIASFLILKESITFVKIAAVACIIGANILLASGKGSFKFNKYLLLAIICAVSLGLAWAIDKKASVYYSTVIYSVIIWALPIFYIASFPLVSFKSISSEFKISTWKIPLLAAANVLQFYFQLKALYLADASKVIPVISSSTVLTVLLGIILLKERNNLGRKIIAGALVFIGVLLLID